MKVKEIYQDYLEFLKLKDKITTIKGIKYKFDKYVIPFFGEYDINSITEKDYIDFQLKIKNLNYSNSFNSQIHTIVRNLFNYLNVMYSVDNIPNKIGSLLPNKKSTTREYSTWSKKEFKKFINKVDDPIYHAFFNLLFYTGLRKSEAMALKISDFSNNCIAVNKSITKELYNGKRLLLSTKTGKNRTIKIDTLLSLELKRLIKYYNKNYKNCNSNSFLFGCEQPLANTTLKRKKDYYCDLAGVKRIRIHDFRHSHATMLYNHKIKIKLIQERLGHADISTTLNTYVHTNQREEKKLIKMINFLRI